MGKKSNEIKAIPKLIKALDLEGCVITINAIGCQHEIVETIVKNKADFVICVKDNQKKLHDTIKSWFRDIDFDGNKTNGHGHIPPTRYQSSYAEECGHGRRERKVLPGVQQRGGGKDTGLERRVFRSLPHQDNDLSKGEEDS